MEFLKKAESYVNQMGSIVYCLRNPDSDIVKEIVEVCKTTKK